MVTYEYDTSVLLSFFDDSAWKDYFWNLLLHGRWLSTFFDKGACRPLLEAT